MHFTHLCSRNNKIRDSNHVFLNCNNNPYTMLILYFLLKHLQQGHCVIPKVFTYKGWMYGLYTEKLMWSQPFECAVPRPVTIKPKAEVWAAARFSTW